MEVTVEMTATLRAQDHGHPPLIFDARGNGGGGISPTITGDHQGGISDYTAIVVNYEEKKFLPEHGPRMVDYRGNSGDA